ncbi:MAG: hypothetical protein P1V34_16335 [Alphaproteobacteria bacterium]|nr:hypothetical protein [Alphaproteobacteria bacterium]
MYIDYSQAEIQGTTEEAYEFGEKLGEALNPFEGLFVAVYIGDAARGSLLVDVSVMIAKKFGLRIRTFNDFDRMIVQTSRHLTGVT